MNEQLCNLGMKFYMCDSHTASIIVENALFFYCPSRLLLWQWTRPHRHWKNKNCSHFYFSINIWENYPKIFIVFAFAQNVEIGIIGQGSLLFCQITETKAIWVISYAVKEWAKRVVYWVNQKFKDRNSIGVSADIHIVIHGYMDISWWVCFVTSLSLILQQLYWPKQSQILQLVDWND